MSALIRFCGLHKSFGAQKVLTGLDLDVAEGTIHFVLGRSGVGKSVLIKHVVGLLKPDAGQVFYRDTDVAALDEEGLRRIRERCQLIFQHPTLFDQWTVLDNVAVPIEKRFRINRSEARQTARAVLDSLAVSGLDERFPPELGKGVQKRISVARALALEPEALLYDEPTTSLDPVSARRLDRLIRKTADDHGVTSIVVSHDLQSVAGIADRISFVHVGRVHFDGARREWATTKDPIVREFLGEGQRWRP